MDSTEAEDLDDFVKRDKEATHYIGLIADTLALWPQNKMPVGLDLDVLAGIIFKQMGRLLGGGVETIPSVSLIGCIITGFTPAFIAKGFVSPLQATYGEALRFNSPLRDEPQKLVVVIEGDVYHLPLPWKSQPWLLLETEDQVNGIAVSPALFQEDMREYACRRFKKIFAYPEIKLKFPQYVSLTDNLRDVIAKSK